MEEGLTIGAFGVHGKRRMRGSHNVLPHGSKLFSSDEALHSFTLIELLLVVAVIAVLSALLLPSLQKAKDRGKAAVCMSNLRQIYNGFALYASDNDDKIPPIGTPYNYLYGTRGQCWFHWLGKGGKYFGSTQNFIGKLQGFPLDNTRWSVFRCPGEPGSRRPEGQKGYAYFDNEMVATSYVMNWSVSWYCYYLGYCPCYTGASCDPYPFRRGFSLGPQDGRPAEAPFVMDCQDMGWGWAQPYMAWDVDIDTSYDFYWEYAFRHGGKANMLFMDGHVEPIRHHKDTGRSIWKALWDGPPPL
jgi:prepilin-type processing-associated H-X9-DG protein